MAELVFGSDRLLWSLEPSLWVNSLYRVQLLLLLLLLYVLLLRRRFFYHQGKSYLAAARNEDVDFILNQSLPFYNHRSFARDPKRGQNGIGVWPNFTVVQPVVVGPPSVSWYGMSHRLECCRRVRSKSKVPRLNVT